MAQRPALHFGAGFAPRGLDLAERRLAYLAELYDSGRWRRFHGDADFLAMVREARAAVDVWRRLLRAEPIEAAQAPAASREDAAALVPPEPVHNENTREHDLTLRCIERAAEPPLWLRRGGRLPPVVFSTYAVVAEGDLAEA